MLQPGQLISEKYRVLEEAGAGELGPLYRVQELETGKVCALKIIKLPDDADRDLLRRLLEDVDRIENLKGPHIIPPGRVEGADGNQPYVVREFLEGVTLEELIRKEAPVPFHRACSIARQVAQALETAHHAGIVHGDLKPSRILLVPGDGAEIVKVLGFGFFTLKQNYFLELSKLALKDGDHPLMGAPEYISPEQAIGTGAEGLDGRSDLYSLGIIWHQMLTGEVPFRGQNTMEILLAHLFTAPPPLH
ncbi:MAG: serine/threonine-protein kinase, partial [Terriglobia bacterium]